MGVISLDFSNVPSREPLEPGWYTARIVEVVDKPASTGSPMWALTYLITGDSDGNPVEGERKVFDNLVMVENCLWKVRDVFQAVGFDITDLCTVDSDELIGLELAVKLVQEMYQGDLRNYVKATKSIDALA